MARQQLDTVVSLSAHAKRYSVNIAELLLLGEAELDDFQNARRDLLVLRRPTEREIAFVRGEAERAEESDELARADAMRALFDSTDLVMERLLLVGEQGRQAEALRLFRERIEDRLDVELEAFIAAAVADERAEVRDAAGRADRLERGLAALVLAVALGAVVVIATAGAVLSRSLLRPIRRLIEGARAIGEGDLGHRIGRVGRDELAQLAQRFDLAAAELECERERLLGVQTGLEDAIARRTGELEGANRRLRRLDRLRSLCLADISHELRTPLTMLQGEAEVTLRGRKPLEEHRDALARIARQAELMGRLVDDLLFLARAEVDVIRFETRPLDLGELWADAVEEGRVLAEAAGLGLEAEAPSPAPCASRAIRSASPRRCSCSRTTRRSTPSRAA